MSAASFDPNTLTKDKLKRELKQHNVTLPSSDSRKDVYVGLYRQHVMKSEPAASVSVIELSSGSDEDSQAVLLTQTRKKRPGSPKKSSSKKSFAAPDPMDIFSLSDTELLEELKRHNIEYGPILDSTRRIYQRKLEKVLSGDVHAEPMDRDSTRDTLPVDEIDFSDRDDGIPEVPSYTQPSRVTTKQESVRQRVFKEPTELPKKTKTRDAADTTPRAGTYTSTTSTANMSSRSHSNSSATSVSQQQPSSSRVSSTSSPEIQKVETPKKGGLSIWVQLIILIVVAILIYLVFQSMEPASTSPTKGIETDV